MSVIPSYLKPGDTIGIVATARWITKEQLQPALDLLGSWGFRVKTGTYLHKNFFQLAGTDRERTEDFQAMLDDDEVKAILVARGGYGTVHIIDQLDFSAFMKKPKWICGYSDITVIHTHLNTRGIASIHSTMPISFPDATPEALENLRQTLTGELQTIRWQTGGQNAPMTTDTATLIGGNLSVISSLLGSASWGREKNGPFILFLEDVDEMLYHIDRMMMALRRAGILDQVQVIILGGMTQMKDNTTSFGFPSENPWGQSATEIVESVAASLSIPVLTGFPAGHQNDNRAFYLGMPCSLVVADGFASLRFQTTRL
jgi:muramoyltetrapeptide carboxypeptidase